MSHSCLCWTTTSCADCVLQQLQKWELLQVPWQFVFFDATIFSFLFFLLYVCPSKATTHSNFHPSCSLWKWQSCLSNFYLEPKLQGACLHGSREVFDHGRPLDPCALCKHHRKWYWQCGLWMLSIRQKKDSFMLWLQSSPLYLYCDNIPVMSSHGLCYIFISFRVYSTKQKKFFFRYCLQEKSSIPGAARFEMWTWPVSSLFGRSSPQFGRMWMISCLCSDTRLWQGDLWFSLWTSGRGHWLHCVELWFGLPTLEIWWSVKVKGHWYRTDD